MRIKAAIITAALLSPFWGSNAQAADVNLSDYVAAPEGTNLLAWYQQHGYYDKIRSDGGSEFRDKTHLRTDISVIRAIHYMKIGNFTINPQVLVPFGRTYDVRSNGTKLNSDSGLADPIVGATIWLINDPEAGNYGRYLGVTGLVYVPLGDYDKHQTINMGQNRWTGDFQVGWIEPLWGKSSLETHVGMFVFSDNDDFNGGQRLEQANMYNLQINYVYALSDVSKIGVGYAQTTGGEQKLDGDDAGLKGGYRQWRMEYQRMLTPQLQVLGQVTHDFDVDGGLRKDYGLNLRLAYFF